MASGWSERDIPSLSGRVVVVTGANSGIGYAAAVLFAQRGAQTILACRDERRGAAALAQLRQVAPEARAELLPLDLSSLASIRAFSAALHLHTGRVDVLVNNAGVMGIPRMVTADGFEMQFGTNHLGHFALTGMLLDLLAASDAARVVTVSSVMSWFGRLRFDDLQSIRHYWRWAAYSQSKLANLLFMLELQRRLTRWQLPVLSVGCHPGYAATNLTLVGPRLRGATLSEWASRIGNAVIAQSPERGALPTLYAATHPDLRGGEHIGPNGLLELRGDPTPARIARRAQDELVARQLWDVSEELTGVRYEQLANAA